MEPSLPKLSLEPRIGSEPYDVSEPNGIETYKSKSSPSDNLREQVRKIYNQRTFKNLTLDSLTEDENGDLEKIEDKKEEKISEKDELAAMKTSIMQTIRQSNNEIGIGIDVLNLILSDYRKDFIHNNPLPVSPGIIHSTYHSYSQPTKPFKVQNLKLMLGMKRKQLKHSAEMLLNAAAKLKDIVVKEETFWNEALSLREHHWSMRRGGKEKNAGHQIFVDYAGSNYLENTLAQISRTPEERQIVISLPQTLKRAVKLKLQQRSSDFNGSTQLVQENSLLHSEATDGSIIHQQLVAAQKAIFEADLIEQMTREARAMPNVTLIENEIFVRIYQGVDLIIQWANIDTIEKTSSMSETWTSALEKGTFDVTISPESSTCTILKLVMELLVRKYHRRHLRKQQERILYGTKAEIVHAYLLSHVIHVLKYHFFCEHVRKIVNEATRALRNGGVPLQVHFISNLAKGKDLIEDVWKKIGNEKVPLFTGMIIVTIDRRHSLRFTLESPTSVTIHLSNGDIKTRDLNQFQDLLYREINLFLLKVVFEQLNYLTGLDNVFFGNSTWCLDTAMMIIYRNISPVLSESTSDDTDNEEKWSKSFWKRPIKVSIVDGYPSPDNLTLRIDAVGIEKCPELIIGKEINGKEYRERIFEFLINLV
ncbi:8351_t:CDS:10 [Diversispora eburnea]|uniref:Mediator of RNA polymerase II transcription subunit 17 n=1 Tax=Diversispora eburnea TaxID=1213867 RepID=A0A9N8VX77_9GLOM|nr:8351_t:CDS:10 [Diversispora eburnea]